MKIYISKILHSLKKLIGYRNNNIFNMVKIEKIKFSKTINALRGISIVGVLFYHAKFDLFQGGFLGVDVFFVISGYLIGNLLLSQDLQKNNLLKNFYTNRLRRLFPALITTLIFTYFLNYFYLLPGDFQSFKISMIYSLIFAANFYFWKETDYFSQSIDTLSLSHLWSLGIEEQFYLLFPILLILFTKFKFLKTNIFKLLFLISLLSFIYNLLDFYNLPLECPAENCIEITNFYWLHTRIWELLIGVLANFITKLVKFNKIVFCLGFLIIVSSFIFLNSNFQHPGFSTLYLVIGTVLVINSSYNYEVNFLSNSRILNFLGNVSYSLYLLHFPIFVIKNYYRFELKILRGFDILPYVLIFISILLSFFSWKYIENPLRNKKKFNNNFIYKFSTISFLTILFLTTNFVPFREFNSENFNYIYSTDFKIKKTCFFESFSENLEDINQCLNPNEGKQNILIVGSSLAQNLYKGFSEVNNENLNIDYIAVTGCPPFISDFEYDIRQFNEQKCENIYTAIKKNSKIIIYDKVILIFDWSSLNLEEENLSKQLIDKVIEGSLEVIQKRNLIFTGQPIIWENRLDILINREIFLKNGNLNKFNSNYLKEDIFSYEKLVTDKLSQNNINYFSFINFFCLDEKCVLFEESEGYNYVYSPDYSHISDYFSKKIANEIEKIFLN